MSRSSYRSLSFSEITKALSCQAAHAFQYTGHLTDGEVLKTRQIAPKLSDGRAWGAAVAAWHAGSADQGKMQAAMTGVLAMEDSYAQDRQEMLERGVDQPPEDRVAMMDRLNMVFGHYIETVEPFPNLTRLEGEIVVPIPTRSGQYQFQCFIDGYTMEYLNHQWIVEFKLRDNLTDPEMLTRSRQHRWYAWALRELQRSQGSQNDLVGVIVDERWNEPPKPARLLTSHAKARPSHAKNQLCTVESYRALCSEYDENPSPETEEVLRTRRWQQRIPILFRDGELDESAKELASAAKLITDLDAGELYPIRNAKPANCRWCDYRAICANPQDNVLVDLAFERRVPKRYREEKDGTGQTTGKA